MANNQAFTSSDNRITYEQKKAISDSIRSRCVSRGDMPTLFAALRRRFGVPTYTELRQDQLPEALQFLEQFPKAPRPAPERHVDPWDTAEEVCATARKEAREEKRRKAAIAAAPDVPESILYLLAVLADFSSALKDFREDKAAAQWLDAAYIKALQQ